MSTKIFFRLSILVIIFTWSTQIFGQNTLTIKATVDNDNKSIHILQTITYYNTTNDTLNVIYLNDWSNSFSSNTTPLANRFAEEYKTDFLFSKEDDKGYTNIKQILQNNTPVTYMRLKQHPDVLGITLQQPLLPKQAYTLTLNYIIKLPNAKFTNYGITDSGAINLRYWYITPAIYNGNWHFYSNKNLDDLYIPPANITLELIVPETYLITSPLNVLSSQTIKPFKHIKLYGENRKNTALFLHRIPDFKTIKTDNFNIVTNIENDALETDQETFLTNRITQYITTNLGSYPFQKLVLSDIDYKKNPVYGLNLLPKFIRPFPKTFLFEMRLLKTALNNFLEDVVLINPRTEQWLIDGLQTYFLIQYVKTYYPDMKLVGKFSKIWGIRTYHLANLDYNDQYWFLYMNMARNNLDQPLNIPKDSLLKFNENIANKYKAGVGLQYLNNFLNDSTVAESIKTFIYKYSLKPVNINDFKDILIKNADKDINWFFTDYISTNNRIDYKIKNVKKTTDSIYVTIQNKEKGQMPIPLFALKNNRIISKTWIRGFSDYKTVSIPNDSIEKLVLNYDYTVPEINARNNWKSLKSFNLINKPIQFQFFKDAENPHYNQVFFIPHFNYNFYDGIALGVKFYNKPFLKKPFLYSFKPYYATKSKQLVGSASLSYTHRLENKALHYIRYGISGDYFNYAPDLFYRSIKPYLQLDFRDEKNLRNNKRKFVNVRYISIFREDDTSGKFNIENEPNYQVFNARYGQTNPNLRYYFKWYSDLQIAKKFGKAAINLEYRKLTSANRSYNIRLFAGSFLYNKTYQNSNYFSFALDRPTDYLFDYNYLGRSESSGLLSQQIIIAEGGFKSKLNTAFANQWMATINGSTTLWKYIHAYGDAGFVKNHNQNAKFVYDSGIRLSLVEDYFELYFPVYSSLGWEITQPHYAEKIRFIITLSPETLLGLFTRRWY